MRSSLILAVAVLFLTALSQTPAAQENGQPPLERYGELKERLDRLIEEKKYGEAALVAEQLNEIVWPLHVDAMYNTARAYYLSGDREKAYEYLFWAVDAGYWDAMKMMKDEAFEGLREEKLYKQLARTARANGYIWMLERDEREEFQKPEMVMDAFEIKPGERIADVGAGSGYFTIPIARMVGSEGKVWAIDAWQDMLDHLERRLAIEQLDNVELVKVDRDDPQLPAGGVDMILMVDVYHYMLEREERVAYGRKLREGLAPGGRLVVIDYIPKSLEERPWGPPPRQHLPEETLTDDLAEAGLKPVKSYDFLPEQYFVIYMAK
jgi:protein-L-isoaspartate O-methyltransferase